MADIGSFDFKPAELTPSLCDDLHDNLLGMIETVDYWKTQLERSNNF